MNGKSYVKGNFFYSLLRVSNCKVAKILMRSELIDSPRVLEASKHFIIRPSVW